jgi:hypothetical protein
MARVAGQRRFDGRTAIHGAQRGVQQFQQCVARAQASASLRS